MQNRREKDVITDLISLAAVVVIIFNVSGLISAVMMYTLLAVLWTCLAAYLAVKYYRAGRMGMVIAVAAAGAAMIGLLVYRIRLG